MATCMPSLPLGPWDRSNLLSPVEVELLWAELQLCLRTFRSRDAEKSVLEPWQLINHFHGSYYLSLLALALLAEGKS